MGENKALLVLLRRLLTANLIALLLVFGIYLGLVRRNSIRSHERGLEAILPARAFWPNFAADVEILRTNITAKHQPPILLFNDQPFISSLGLLTAKHQHQVIISNGTEVSVQARIYLRTDNDYIWLSPGHTKPYKDQDFWLPTTVEIIAAQQDMLIADFIISGVGPSWTLDPLERETRLNTNPGVISWALLVNAPGGYESTIKWVSQLGLMLFLSLLTLAPTYVWHDAHGRYRKAILWTAVVAATNLVGLLPYLLFGRITATVCHECSQAITSEQKFCPYCRTRLHMECFNCGQPLRRNWHYCSACGAKPPQYP
jgi:hypothetical protein